MVLTPDGAQPDVTLLTREHSPYWYDGEQEANIARFDLDRQHKDRQFHVSIDPFDLAATTDGALVVTSGLLAMWTDIAVFDGDSGEPRGAPVHGIRELTTLELHPSEQRLYAAGDRPPGRTCIAGTSAGVAASSMPGTPSITANTG